MSISTYTRAAKKRRTSRGDDELRYSTSLLYLPLDVIRECMLYMSIHDLHFVLPQVSKSMNSSVKSRPWVTQQLTKTPGLKIPRSWKMRLLNVKYISNPPPRVRFPPNIRTLSLENVRIKNWREQVGADLLGQIDDLSITNCYIDMFDGIIAGQLKSLKIVGTVLHDLSQAESGRIDMHGMCNLRILDVRGSCNCTHIFIGDIFSSCKKLQFIYAPIHFDVFLDPTIHIMPMLEELHFSKQSHNIIQVQADMLPLVAPRLTTLSHPDVRVDNMRFIRKLKHLVRAVLIRHVHGAVFIVRHRH